MKNFKAALFLMLLCPLGALNLSAQVSVGVRGGVNFSNINTEFEDPSNDFDISNRAGYAVAVPIEIMITDFLAVQPELMYHQKGGKEELSFFGISATQEYIFNYVEVPVLLKVLAGGENIGVGLLAGPAFSYARSGEYIISVLGTVESVDLFDTEDDEIFFDRKEFNLHLGAAPYINVAGLKIFADGRYILGLNDISDEESNSAVAPEEYGTVKNRTVQVTAGVIFNF